MHRNSEKIENTKTPEENHGMHRCNGLRVVALIFHSLVKFVAAPTWFTSSFGSAKKRNKLAMIKASSRERIAAQLDVAAKGVYILINDFNTMSRLVIRLDDEIEHSKALAHMCARNENIKVLKEVVWEFRIEETCFNERLDELEEHIYRYTCVFLP